MALPEDKKRLYMKRIVLSKMRILVNNGFYGLLLMHMIYAIDEKCETAATDGKRIIFSPTFLDELNDDELDFVLMHEVLHVVLKHALRKEKRDHLLFNIACDIVVNSNILFSLNMDLSAITIRKYGQSMHLAPNGKEGYLYTAEEVYEMFPKDKEINKLLWDDHSRWGSHGDETLVNIWRMHFEEACDAVESLYDSNSRGIVPMCAERYLKEIRKSETNWQTILNDFIQEEITDYSLLPPDKRFDDNPFFLPDFNEKEEFVENILFMIDTSSSMTDQMITNAYLEIKSAIDQFNGRLKGWLGFFTAKIIEPKPFSDEKEFKIIKPKGSGGTDFEIIFNYVNEHMQSDIPASIIIITDGYAPFPNKSITKGIPVLWLLNNEKVKPPWGRVARFRD